ncbi:MAG: adenosine kinase [Planctomycetales bacterium]|nr:adenosine kinase [Planctomycetales bacterium]NIM09155.1 adenosine kinase [Planctomycetales bacterium]NIN08622.1 adenosine kinase [Planctomycetales bacterium]NIN77748.1 adenosine kinase [Planctomycetales bacterium]NIO34920.1 adenosine kinase [Planctomycetales bacterium]
MIDTRYDVLGIGNAIVDVLSAAKESFLQQEGLSKGAMTLIDADRAESLYAGMGPGHEISGGSAANTMVGVAQLGGQAAFVGKVRDDQLGAIFRHDLTAAGVTFVTPDAQRGPPTARSLILVTPDAQRTMNTYLGACVHIGPEDVDEEVVSRAKVTYLEGYLWDMPPAKEAFLRAARIAHTADQEVALTLSDAFCVDRHRDSFLELVERHIDILFANEQELLSLYQVQRFDEALQHVRGHCRIAALTRSEKGAVILSGNEVHVVDAEPVREVVDTTGAGDLFAAGFLYGHTQGWALERCGRLGAVAASEIISHYGARPEANLAALAKARLG